MMSPAATHPPMDSFEFDHAYQQAQAALQAGNWPLARTRLTTLRDTLQRTEANPPQQAACLALLGRVHWKALDLAASQACWQQAVQLDAQPAWQGWLAEAEQLLARQASGALSLAQPPSAELPQAVKLAHQQALLTPNSVEALCRLGTVLVVHQRMAEAVVYFERALVLAPEHAQVANNLGHCYLQQKRYVTARNLLQHTLARHPDDLHVQINLANALAQCGELDEALAMHQRVLQRQPDDMATLVNLATLQIRRQAFASAQGYLDQVLSRQPDHLDALSAQVDAWRFQHQFEATISLLEQLMVRQPTVAQHPRRLGSALRQLGRHASAIAAYQQALALDPGDSDTYSNLLLTLQYAPGYSPEAVFDWHRGFGLRYERPRPTPRQHNNSAHPQRRLRVGWVSGDFNSHPVAYFILPVWSERHRQQFDCIAYDTSLNPDAVTEQLRPLADVWRRVRGATSMELARQIQQDQIDILIDLSGHTGGHRLLAFAHHPAPVQVSWLGYADTSGLSRIHWRISDGHGDPAGAEARYTERLWRLPEVFCCYRPMVRQPALRHRADYAVQPTPALQHGQITFGCCNNYAKITDDMIALWSRLLHRVAGSRLLLELAGIQHGQARTELQARFAQHGIAATRLQLEERDSRWQYLRYHQIDIALDPFPANGGTSSCDVLWMGVPLVTLAGTRFVSRMGVSLLHAVGHPEWVAQDQADYLDIAARLAADIPALNAIRLALRGEMEASRLMDEAGFTRQFEAALRGMWQAWCAQQTGQPLPDQGHEAAICG